MKKLFFVIIFSFVTQLFLAQQQFADLALNAIGGDALSQLKIGMKYLNGNDCEKDEELGLFWLIKAAKQNNAEAQFLVGNCYLNAIGTSMDSYEAVKWYKKAQRQDHALATMQLGICYLQGIGCSQDVEKAEYYMSRALDLNRKLIPMKKEK